MYKAVQCCSVLSISYHLSLLKWMWRSTKSFWHYVRKFRSLNVNYSHDASMKFLRAPRWVDCIFEFVFLKFFKVFKNFSSRTFQNPLHIVDIFQQFHLSFRTLYNRENSCTPVDMFGVSVWFETFFKHDILRVAQPSLLLRCLQSASWISLEYTI